MCESISCGEIRLPSWMGARGTLVGTRLVWRRLSTARAVTFSCLFKVESARRWPPLKDRGPPPSPSPSSTEINSIWCPEDGWNSPQRHGVYEFREIFFVNRRGKMKARKNEDEVGGNAVYETTRIHSQGDAVSNRTNTIFFRNSFQPARWDSRANYIQMGW